MVYNAASAKDPMTRFESVTIPMALPGDDLDQAELCLDFASRKMEESSLRGALAEALDALEASGLPHGVRVLAVGRPSRLPVRVFLEPIGGGSPGGDALKRCALAIEKVEERCAWRRYREPSEAFSAGSLLGWEIGADKPWTAAEAALRPEEAARWADDWREARSLPRGAAAQEDPPPAWSGASRRADLPMPLPGEGWADERLSRDPAREAETRLGLARALAILGVCPSIAGATIRASKSTDEQGDASWSVSFEPIASGKAPSAAARFAIAAMASFFARTIERSRPGLTDMASFDGKPIRPSDPAGAARLLLSDEQFARWMADWERRQLSPSSASDSPLAARPAARI